MPNPKVKIQPQQSLQRSHFTQLTEQDLTISYSKDLPELKYEQDSTTYYQIPSKGSKKKSIKELTFSSLANLSKLFNQSCDQSFESVNNQETANNKDIYQETIKIQHQQKRGASNLQSPIENVESSSTKATQLLKPSKLSLKTMKMKQQLQGYFESKNQKQIEEYVKKLDKQLKELNANKNRLKYILRIKEGNVANQELIETKICPCCGKTITKLCFHCQHDRCQKSSCPRMKKQKLNAKMLVKLKEKKVGSGENRRFRRSRDKDLRRQTPKKGFNDQSVSFNSDQYESEPEMQNSQDENQKKEGYRLRNREAKNTKEQHFVNFDKTMTDFALHQSKLFVDSDQQQ